MKPHTDVACNSIETVTETYLFLMKEIIERDEWKVDFNGGYIVSQSQERIFGGEKQHARFDFLLDYYRRCLRSYEELTQTRIESALKEIFTYTAPPKIAIAIRTDGTTEEVLIAGEKSFDRQSYQRALTRKMERSKKDFEQQASASSQMMLTQLMKEPSFMNHPFILEKLNRYLQKTVILQHR